MIRQITMATGLGVILCTMGAANAATYCAKYVGGHERVGSGARSQCEYSTLAECRASVRGVVGVVNPPTARGRTENRERPLAPSPQ